jgi:hypothetical protein
MLLHEWFLPTLRHIKIECLSCEQLIDHIRSIDSDFESELSDFYEHCLKFNRLQEREHV